MRPVVRYALAREVSGRRSYLACRSGSNFQDALHPIGAQLWYSMQEIGDWIDALPTRETLRERRITLTPNELSHREEFDGRGYKIVMLRIDVTVEDPALEPTGAK